jgi:2-polyprenyl-3-methyl-5-hydroxy-6-metoxy-1,4-benzoquinol methylase
MSLTYYQFKQIGREQWLAERNFFKRAFIRLFGPLGVHARIRNARVINLVRRIHITQKARILDAGCGHAYATFWLARRYPDYCFSALESNPQLVITGKEIAAKMRYEHVEFVQANVIDLNEVAKYDLIYSIDMLEHIVDDVGVLHRFHRALKPNGHLVLHLPRRHQEHRRFFPFFKTHTTPDHVRDEYTAEEIQALLGETQFKIKYLRYGFSILGELAFELNYMFWSCTPLRVLTALLTHPLCVWLAYLDIRRDYDDGNSLIIHAKPLAGER